MSLVAYDGSSDEDDVEDMDTSENITITPKANSEVEKAVSSQVKPSSVEDIQTPKAIEVDNFPTSAANPFPASSWSTKLKFEESLPKPKVEGELGESNDIEIGPIPPKKVYGDEDKYLPPSKTVSTSFQNLTSKKINGVVKISIPSLKDFEDENTANTGTKKIVQPSKKGSGLFAVLPPPKNSGVSLMTMANEAGNKSTAATAKITNNQPTLEATTSSEIVPPTPKISQSMPKSLVPDSVKLNLSGKRPATSKLDEIRAKYLKQDANVRIVHSGKGSSNKPVNSDDSDDDGEHDYFSLDSSDMIVNDPAALEKLQLPTPSFEQPTFPDKQTTWETEGSEMYTDAQPSTSASNDIDVMKFVKKGKKGEAINFIEVNADDLRPDTTEWLKNITDESAVPARRSKGLGGAVKRKHQITYLAFEAKAREQELQNTWAQNRSSRRQTQSKYGF